MINNGRRKVQTTQTPPSNYNNSTIGYRFLDLLLQNRKRQTIDQRADLGMFIQRIPTTQFEYSRCQCGHEVLRDAFVDVEAIRTRTVLARVTRKRNCNKRIRSAFDIRISQDYKGHLSVHFEGRISSEVSAHTCKMQANILAPGKRNHRNSRIRQTHVGSR
ncbi:hypothetical protein WK70_04475 [Burkholderia cepacia]|nr:hypothetical protein WK70_04475 [Burkholderia cepacia]